MNPSQSSIGEKIRNYRKRAGLSQLELEVAISASNGMISRIESGQTNPTKETLFFIADALKLSQPEKADLFGIKNLYPTQEEIDAARAEVKDHFANPEVVAYVIDDWTNLIDASKSMVAMFNLDPSELPQYLGRKLLDLLLDRSLKIYNHFDPDYLPHLLALEFMRIHEEAVSEYFLIDLADTLKKYPEYAIIEQESPTIGSKILSASEKTIHLISEGKKVKCNFSRERLKKNPRFEVIEYFNFQPYE